MRQIMRPKQVRRQRSDPAPSRLSYRIQRWMLTPGIRMALRVGIPFVLVFAVVSAYLADADRRAAIQTTIADIRTSIEERPEFMVSLMAIDGAGPALADDIRAVFPIDFPISSFDLDIETMRDTIAGLDPVKSAIVRIRPGGVLQVDVVERQPVVIWRSRKGLALLDETGTFINTLTSRSERPDLPLILGKGANQNVAEALALFQAAKPLGDRMRGIVRIGERRWDVALDRDQAIMLPAQQPVSALQRVIALSEAQDMLSRDVAVVDMRIGARPTLRMTPEAVKDWWQIREINGRERERRIAETSGH